MVTRTSICAVKPCIGETVRVGRTQYIWGPCESKLLFTELLIDMLCMEGGALADDVASGAPNHDVESARLPLARMGFKQALASFHFVPEKAQRCNDSIHAHMR